MKPHLWLPILVFLAVSIPLVLILNALEFGGDARVWIALVAGAAAMAYTQHRLKNNNKSGDRP